MLKPISKLPGIVEKLNDDIDYELVKNFLSAVVYHMWHPISFNIIITERCEDPNAAGANFYIRRLLRESDFKSTYPTDHPQYWNHHPEVWDSLLISTIDDYPDKPIPEKSVTVPIEHTYLAEICKFARSCKLRSFSLPGSSLLCTILASL